LIAPLRYKDHWGDGKKEDQKIPWWFYALSYVMIPCCMMWPILGWIVLVGVAMFMMWNFIQVITESGPYAK
jgi:hypothetical protein